MGSMKRKVRRSADEYLDEVKGMILAKYPDAEFDVIRRRRHEITVDVLTDGDNGLEIGDLTGDRRTDILLEAGLLIVVVPLNRRYNSN
jgi:hypothetical protein